MEHPDLPTGAPLLVTGGAGYIGSHTVAELVACGFEVAVLDDLSTGHRRFVPPGVPLFECDLRDAASLRALFSARPFAAVVHFAAKSLVGESMRDPSRYYDHNLNGTRHLLDAMVEAGVGRIVFSSSAAVYGEPDLSPIPESAPLEPTNPYGETKRAMERLLGWYGRAHGIRSIALRYFNAAGAAESGGLGELHDPETHLIPLVLLHALGRRPKLEVFGDDYPTPDGSCVRDYIHVEDLALAHRVALARLFADPSAGAACDAYNVGYGRGSSVFEVIDACRRVTGVPLTPVVSPRRAGDPARLVADAGRIGRELGFRPGRDDLDRIVRSAWDFTRRNA